MDTPSQQPTRPRIQSRPDGPAYDTEDVRAGETNHGVRYVLGFGLAGAIIALAVAWFGFFGPQTP